MRVNGINLNVEQLGEGEPLVMLHGLSANLEWMRPEMERLSRVRRVIAIDLRGHGRSERPAQYTLSDHVNDVIGVLDALDLPWVDLMGTSMGSYVAQGVATRVPGRVRKLLLVVSKASGSTSSMARIAEQYADQLRGKSDAEVQAFLMGLLFAPGTPPEVRAAVAGQAQQDVDQGLNLSPEQYAAANRALEGFDFRPELPNVTADTLVISGRFDPANPPERGEEIARLIPHAHFVVMEHSGHMPDVEEPDALLSAVEDFLTA